MKKASIIAAALSLLALLGLAMRGSEPPVNLETKADDPARYIIRGASLRRHDEQGAVRVEGWAETIRYYDDDSAELQNFKVRVEGDRDNKPWIARASQGFSPAGNRHLLRLYGGVEGDGHWPDGEALIFNAEEVWVNAEDDSLQTDSEVTLRSASRIGKARGLRISGKRESVALRNDVEIHYVLP